MDTIGEITATLGESPLWHRELGLFLWVDIVEEMTYAFDPATGETRTFISGRPVTALAEAGDDQIVMVTSDGILVGDPAMPTMRADLDLPDTVRANDGKCDPSGRLWFGTMDRGGRRPLGELMCLDGSVRSVFHGVTISNGLGWSPDGEVFYHIDSVPGMVYRHHYDPATGSATGREILVDLSSDPASPDGMAVDAEGNLWVAMWDGGAINVYDPDGHVVHVEELPVARPTSIAFGGPDLGDVYVTSASIELTDEDRRRQPYAGRVFRLRPGVTGLPLGRFQG